MARKGSRKRLNKRGGTTPEATADVQAATSGVNVADIKGMFSNLGANLGNKVSSSLGDVNSKLEELHATGKNTFQEKKSMIENLITSKRDAAAELIKGQQPAPGPTGGRRRRSTKRKTARRSRSKRSRTKHSRNKRSRKNKRKTNKRSRSRKH